MLLLRRAALMLAEFPVESLGCAGGFPKVGEPQERQWVPAARGTDAGRTWLGPGAAAAKASHTYKYTLGDQECCHQGRWHRRALPAPLGALVPTWHKAWGSEQLRGNTVPTQCQLQAVPCSCSSSIQQQWALLSWCRKSSPQCQSCRRR